MNLIEAWNKAKDGQKIVRRSNSVVVYKDSRYLVCGQFRVGKNVKTNSSIAKFNLLADDWEIVKENRINCPNCGHSIVVRDKEYLERPGTFYEL